MRYEIVPASMSHVGPLASRMTEAPLILAAGGKPRRWLRWQLGQSTEAWTGFIGGVSAGMWGVTGSPLESEGTVWAAFTDLARQHPLTMLRGASAWLEYVLIGRRSVTSLIRASDPRARRFAEHLGFKVWEDEPITDSGVRCYPITKTRS